MTPENLAKHRADSNIAFWRNLKEGSDFFEVTGEEPPVAVANMRYNFGAEPAAVAEKRVGDEQKVAEFVSKGVPAVRTVYDDGGGHSSFHRTMAATAGGSSDNSGALAFLDTRSSRRLGEISRPEALASGPREVPVAAAKGKEAAKTKVAAARQPAAEGAAPTAVAAPRAAETRSLYQRALSLFGRADEPPATAEVTQPAAATPAPVPPRRGASAAPAGKPQAAVPPSDRRAALNVSATNGG
jgi:hypothetical protein